VKAGGGKGEVMIGRGSIRHCLLAAGLLLISALAACSSSVTPVNVTPDGIAIKGYDPVAYFTDGGPVKGKQEFRYEWEGAKWLFASAGHRDLFKADPGKYAPQYGGYCAYAVSQGKTADIDPEAWNIVDGRLYLNLSKDVQKKWSSDIPGYIKKADRNWPHILGGK
jgi:YHS domain-containing protein